MKYLVIGVIAIVSNLTTIAQGQEGKIRQATQNSIVQGAVGQTLNFTVTGQLTDTVAVRDRNGVLLFHLTFNQLKNSVYCQSSFVGSNGETNVRVAIHNIAQRFNQGIVRIKRGSAMIDTDRIVLN